METPNNTQMVDAIERSKLSPKQKTSTSKDGKGKMFKTDNSH